MNVNISSLEILCLNLIVKKFNQFYFAFTVSKDRNLQQKFDFLQRRFSAELASILYERKKLREEYLKFLIQEHLNELDGNWLKNSSCSKSIEEIFRRLPNLRKICFRYCDCSDDVLKYVAKFCPKVIEIDVSYSSVTDNGIKYLCEKENGQVPCPEIRCIFIKKTRVTIKGAECLIRNIPLLERLDYPKLPLIVYSIHKRSSSELEKVQKLNLVELDFSECECLISKYADVLRTCFAACPKLESVICCISDTTQLSLFSSTNLKKLHLEFATDQTTNIDNFLRMNGCNLTSLKVSYCTISLFSLAMHCPALKKLHLHNVDFAADDKFQGIFLCLIKCEFSLIFSSQLPKAIGFILTSSPKLESIAFRFISISSEIKTQILMWCKYHYAQKVEFEDLKLEKDFLRDILLGSPCLKTVIIEDCSFDDDDTEAFIHDLSKKLPNHPVIVLS